MFQLYLLRSIKYSPATLSRFQIYFSKTFNHYASFSQAVAVLYPKAVLHKIEFGDLSLTPCYRKLLKAR